MIMKKFAWAVGIVVILIAAFYVLNGFIGAPAPSSAASPKDASYVIDGQTVALTDGREWFGNEATADLDGDGLVDVAFLFTEDKGGSGTFFYVAVAMGGEGGYRGTNAILLGDRIAPQTVEIAAGQVIVNYAERKPGEPFTAQPSVGVSRYFAYGRGELVETTVR